jgi:hypothetical protein
MILKSSITRRNTASQRETLLPRYLNVYGLESAGGKSITKDPASQTYIQDALTHGHFFAIGVLKDRADCCSLILWEDVAEP